MKKSVKVTTAALCAIMLAAPFATVTNAAESDTYTSSGEYISEHARNFDHGGNIYLDLSEKAYAGVRVLLNGGDIISGQGRIINSVTYVPLRAFCDALGVGASLLSY